MDNEMFVELALSENTVFVGMDDGVYKQQCTRIGMSSTANHAALVLQDTLPTISLNPVTKCHSCFRYSVTK